MAAAACDNDSKCGIQSPDLIAISSLLLAHLENLQIQLGIPPLLLCGLEAPALHASAMTLSRAFMTTAPHRSRLLAHTRSTYDPDSRLYFRGR
jgi:hypothetical protein